MSCNTIPTGGYSDRNWRPRTQSILLVTLLALGIAFPLGCKKSDQAEVDVQPATPGNTATAPSTTGPATQSADGTPEVLIPAKAVNVFVTIDDRLVQFPPVRLMVRDDEEGMVAQLTSIDLPDEDVDTANGLFLQMRLSEPTLDRIGQATWHYRAADEEQQEPPRGLFLAGGRRLLQPYDVEIAFDQQADGVRVRMTGRFLSFNNSADAPEDQTPKSVNVTSSFVVEVDKLK